TYSLDLSLRHPQCLFNRGQNNNKLTSPTSIPCSPDHLTRTTKSIHPPLCLLRPPLLLYASTFILLCFGCIYYLYIDKFSSTLPTSAYSTSLAPASTAKYTPTMSTKPTSVDPPIQFLLETARGEIEELKKKLSAAEERGQMRFREMRLFARRAEKAEGRIKEVEFGQEDMKVKHGRIVAFLLAQNEKLEKVKEQYDENLGRCAQAIHQLRAENAVAKDQLGGAKKQIESLAAEKNFFKNKLAKQVEEIGQQRTLTPLGYPPATLAATAHSLLAPSGARSPPQAAPVKPALPLAPPAPSLQPVVPPPQFPKARRTSPRLRSASLPPRGETPQPIPASSVPAARSVICVNCHANWWEHTCDQVEPCGNCVVEGKHCARPKCKDFAMGACPLAKRSCKRAHEDDGFGSLEEYKKDMRRKMPRKAAKTAPVSRGSTGIEMEIGD
ncbi:hypothetical protein CC78DRAFT_605064, partial [Lojkania enalia]